MNLGIFPTSNITLTSSDLLRVIQSNDRSAFDHILKSNPGCYKEPLSNGHIPIDYAIRKGHYDIVKILLECCPIDLDEKDSQGLTPVDHALISGDPKMQALVIGTVVGKCYENAEKEAQQVRFSLSRQLSEEVQKLRTPDLVGASEFQRQAFNGGLSQLEKLGHNDINFQDVKGWTALHYSCLGGQEKIVEWLLKNGAKTDLLSHDRKSPLHFASIRGSDKVLQLLLSSTQLDPNAVDVQGRTPLHYASVDPSMKSATILIQKGADPLNRTLGTTPLGLLMHGIRTRAKSRDSLKMDIGSALMCVSIVGSWIMRFNGYHESAKALRGLASIAAIPMALNTVSPRLLMAFCVLLPGNAESVAASLQIGKTALVGINYLNFAAENRKNSHLEIYRPLRNALIHSINLFDTALETFDHFTLPQGSSHGYGSKGTYGSGGYGSKGSYGSGGYGSKGSYGSGSHGSGGYAGGSSVSKPGASGCKGDKVCERVITYGAGLTVNDPFHPIPDAVKKSWASEVFGIKDGFKLSDCKKAYIRLSKKYHPDKCGQNPVCQQVFSLVGAAYAALDHCK